MDTTALDMIELVDGPFEGLIVDCPGALVLCVEGGIEHVYDMTGRYVGFRL